MVVQVYITGVSGNAEVKSRQQRVLSILDSKSIKYEVIDITGEDGQNSKKFMHVNSTSSGATMSDPNPKYPLPPQIFNDGLYCGDYELFDEANELGELKIFLKIEEENTLNEELHVSNAEMEFQ